MILVDDVLVLKTKDKFPVFRIFTRRSSTSSSGSASDPGEHPRENLHLDYNFPGDRYDAKELVEYSKALRNSPAIQLPRLHTKEEYKVWKNEVPLHFEPRTLGDITYGGECYDVDFGLRRVKFTEWYRARMNKAFSALALSVDLLFTLKVDEIQEDMEAASILWSFITKRFEAGDGINPDYLLRDLMMRLMQPNKSVTKYANDIELKVAKLRQVKGDFEEEYANWLNDHDRKTLRLAEVLQRLGAAEHQRQQLESQLKPAAARTAQVAHVGANQNKGKHRKRGSKQRKIGKGVIDKKARTNCANCGGDGHWWMECTETTGKPLKPSLEKKKKARAGAEQATHVSR
ncbi:hypothetical protein PC119_g12315 [Phytophthora cactorum]|nr:hypothetical protein PC114_g17900 [Phytophthora cactorum]KAG3013957.1 hypothetical protein PC119_g12315 [Phytophthora cactorum]